MMPLRDIEPYDFDNCNKDELQSLSKKIDFSKLNGKIIGEHNGAHYYTIGQRKGIGIGGFKQALFVIGTNTIDNILYLGEGEHT
jgi:tRNA-specific 2-thiouridylase